MATYLDRILDVHRAAAAIDDRPFSELYDAACSSPDTRGFRDSLAAVDPVLDGIAVISEVKGR